MGRMTDGYIVLDLETTGLDYKTEQITEIGAIKLDTEFKEIGRFHTMVSLEEGRKLPEFITKLTGITTEDLVGKPSEQEALKSLAEFIGDSKIVVAQNAPFDLSFISRGGIEPEYFACTRALVRQIEPELSPSLKDVTARNGIVLNGHHRALNDVEATIEVFKLYVHKEHQVMYFNVVIDAPERPLTFIPKNARVVRITEAK
ncbi:3'-5' exonuclease [Peribacillus butanolivorans]|uniref:3'-5' exonuclease n=1 Tax=Peribacillus butanolivorans TaxID=421767 RepID=UPI00207C6BBD|nr:3'-5' exonuclease [Peribacillus butanolivorans]MCO0597415.1 3'-5' exonuclease [Peribacillus butanolivorans]